LWDEFKNELSTIAGNFSTKVETKVQSGVAWYESAIRAAVYGLVSGVLLWALIAVGVTLHLRKTGSHPLVALPEPANADSRVDKIIG
jgi:hypothetical protein